MTNIITKTDSSGLTTKEAFFADSTAGIVSQTGAELTERVKGVTITLYFGNGAQNPPTSAELMAGNTGDSELDMYADIGLEWNGNTLDGYDGVFDIPREIIAMLRELGFVIDPFIAAPIVYFKP